MTTVNRNSPLGHILMSDGTEYDIHVSYTNSKKEPLAHDLTLEPAVQAELQNLIQKMAIAHVKKAGKSFKDLKVINLTEGGIVFPDKTSQSHDIALEPTEAPYANVNELWKKTAQLLVKNFQASLDDCIEIPVSTDAANTPKTVIDLKVTPPVEPSAPPASDANTPGSPPPSYTGATPAAGTIASPPPSYAAGTELTVQGNPAQQGAIVPSASPARPGVLGRLWRELTSPLRPDPMLDIGHLPEDFKSDHLNEECQEIVRKYLTLPTPQPAPKPTAIHRLLGKLPEESPPPALPSFDENIDENTMVSLKQILETFMQHIEEQTKEFGFGAIVDAMNRQCQALVEALPQTGADGYANQLKGDFKNKLVHIFEAEAKKQHNKRLVKNMWDALNDEQRNKIKNYGAILTGVILERAITSSQ